MTPIALRTSEPGTTSNIFKQAIHRAALVSELGRRNVAFWLTYLS